MLKNVKKTFLTLAGVAAIAVTVAWSTPALCQSDPFIGQISMFGGNFAPRGWALCNGQVMSISENQALFSILGNTYGGDGRTTFGLPDLRGRAAIHAGAGPGLTRRILGSMGGTEINTLQENQMPTHNHTANSNATTTVKGTNSPANATAPGGNTWAQDSRLQIYSNAAPSDNINSASVDVQVTTSIENRGVAASK
ncbi:MAG: phage tail protein [Candidatus Anammoxibacter sp.]